jgi:hypothetical protein
MLRPAFLILRILQMFCINCSTKLKLHRGSVVRQRFFCSRCWKVGLFEHNYNFNTGEKCPAQDCFLEKKGPLVAKYIITKVQSGITLSFS